MKVENSKGKIYYGMHFYPGVAEYSGPEDRVFLNEDTIRSMDASFAGAPIYVEHVDEVPENPGELVDKESDGVVSESFYNAADGKHWVKFIITTERGERAIQSGFRLSNAYVPKSFGNGGVAGGVAYQREVLAGEFEHLAIVNNPRYEESVIMTPEQFKKYNEDKEVELKRISNSKDKPKEKKMAFNLFKRTKVENSADLENTMVEIGKDKKPVSISDAITMAEKLHNMHGYASGDHMVKVGEEEMSVNDLVKKHMDVCNKMSEMEKNDAEEGMDSEDAPMDNAEDEKETVEEGEEDVGDRGGDKAVENEDEGEDKEEKKSNSKAKAAAAKAKADAIKNAHRAKPLPIEQTVVELSSDKMERGKQRYGSRS